MSMGGILVGPKRSSLIRMTWVGPPGGVRVMRRWVGEVLSRGPTWTDEPPLPVAVARRTSGPTTSMVRMLPPRLIETGAMDWMVSLVTPKVPSPFGVRAVKDFDWET